MGLLSWFTGQPPTGAIIKSTEYDPVKDKLSVVVTIDGVDEEISIPAPLHKYKDKVLEILKSSISSYRVNGPTNPMDYSHKDLIGQNLDEIK